MSSSSLEETLSKSCESLSTCCQERVEECSECIRTSPIQSLLVAAAAGYILNLLPIGKILGGLAKLVLSLIKPALLLFGLLKAIDFVRCQKENACLRASEKESEHDPVLDSPQ